MASQLSVHLLIVFMLMIRKQEWLFGGKAVGLSNKRSNQQSHPALRTLNYNEQPCIITLGRDPAVAYIPSLIRRNGS